MKDPYKMAVVLPVYNEGQKIVSVAKRVVSFSTLHRAYFFLFVDDGSRDETYSLIKDMVNDAENVDIVRYEINRGKGYAVKYGFDHIEAELYCFTDSDLAYPLELLETIERELERHPVVIGSRKLLDRKRRPNLLRHILGEGYNRLMRIILGLPYKDTQAGFKGFRGDVVRAVFPKMTIRGFGFDPEILYMANKLGFSIKEIPVSETEGHSYKAGKLKLTKDSLRMLRDLMIVRINSLLNRY